MFDQGGGINALFEHDIDAGRTGLRDIIRSVYVGGQHDYPHGWRGLSEGLYDDLVKMGNATDAQNNDMGLVGQGGRHRVDGASV